MSERTVSDDVMRWLRARLRICAAVGLLAMALQIVATFGHVHLSVGSNFPAAAKFTSFAKAPGAQAVVAADGATADTDAGGPLRADGDLLCPLCLTGHLVASAIAPDAPVLALPVAYAALVAPWRLADKPDRAESQTPFWSRGPPVS
jgi:hypothetical protein